MAVKKVHLGLRVTPDLREAIKRAEDAHGVSATDVVVQCVTERLLAAGFLKTGDGHGTEAHGQPGVGGGGQ